MGSELLGRRVGILGLGRIGHAVAERLAVFGVTMQYYDPGRDDVAERNLTLKYVSIPVLLASSDIISVYVPLNSQTESMLSHREFAMMKNDVYLVKFHVGRSLMKKVLSRLF